jgi:hypothetical protein
MLKRGLRELLFPVCYLENRLRLDIWGQFIKVICYEGGIRVLAVSLKLV